MTDKEILTNFMKKYSPELNTVLFAAKIDVSQTLVSAILTEVRALSPRTKVRILDAYELKPEDVPEFNMTQDEYNFFNKKKSRRSNRNLVFDKVVAMIRPLNEQDMINIKDIVSIYLRK